MHWSGCQLATLLVVGPAPQFALGSEGRAAVELLLFRIRWTAGCLALGPWQTKFRKLSRVAEPANRPTARAHPGIGAHETVLQDPKLRFFRNEIDQTRAAYLAFDEFPVTTDRANFARVVQVFVAVEYLHDGVQVLLPEPRGVAHFAIRDLALAHPAIKRGFAHIQVFSRLANRIPFSLSGR